MIPVPVVLTERLDADVEFSGVCRKALADFGPVFQASGTPFFPEYTDHGPGHLGDVLSTAVSLISDESWHLFSSTDALALVLAVILHDAGMHIDEAGFAALLAGSHDHALATRLHDQRWAELWSDFLVEATRFNAKSLTSLFGDTNPIKPPLIDGSPLEFRTRLLVGEFLRRHHHRLAHEIATVGMPSGTGPTIRLGGLDPDLVDLAGLIARSHGADLRTGVDSVRIYDARQYRLSHPTYLMAVLRISDYLQVHSARAPKQVLQVRTLRSPLSLREWKSHLSMLDVRTTHEDPEAIFIQAHPPNAALFLRLRALLAGLQTELDAAWGVLGEIYGRFPPLNRLGLTIRRVRSNLDDVKTFSATVPYVPRRVAIQVADAELIDLLVAPLYGDNPIFGVREMIQNAADACAERADVDPQFMASQASRTCEVRVGLEETNGERWFVCDDLGVGMTEDVIIEYFLRAGASFRKSETWRREHSNRHGQARVARSGRFGIGVLAGFLLGEQIEVTTRHWRSPARHGLEYCARLDADNIELRRCQRDPGTTIRIRMTERRWDRLASSPRSWDWFRAEWPRVIREIRRDGRTVALDQALTVPSLSSQSLRHWRRTYPDGYAALDWTHSATPALICNGITVIGQILKGGLPNKTQTLGEFYRPVMSVWDKEGRLPLNLQRTEVYDGLLPFAEELQEAMRRDYFGFLLTNLPVEALPFGRRALSNAGAYRGLYRTDLSLVMTPLGVTAFRPWPLGGAKIRRMLVLSPSFRDRRWAWTDFNIPQAVTIFDLDRLFINNRTWSVVLEEATGIAARCFLGARFFVSTARAVQYRTLGEGHIVGDHTLIEVGDCPPTSADFHAMVGNGLEAFEDVSELYLSDTIDGRRSWVDDLWMSVIKEPVIPIDDASRIVVLKHAYEDLAISIAANQQELGMRPPERT